MADDREALGRLVRETWVAWAREQPDPKGSWLTGWDELDGGQREADMRIGHAVACYALTENAITWDTSCTSCAKTRDSAYAETVRREKAEAKLAAIAEYCRTRPELAGAGFPQMAGDILAIIGDEGEGRD